MFPFFLVTYTRGKIMTKKDYIAIAKVVKNARDIESSNRESETTKNAICDIIAYDLCKVMQSDNPNFDRNRFLLACGVTPS